MKIARGRELLTPEQRQAFMQIPEDEWVLGTYYIWVHMAHNPAVVAACRYNYAY